MKNFGNFTVFLSPYLKNSRIAMFNSFESLILSCINLSYIESVILFNNCVYNTPIMQIYSSKNNISFLWYSKSFYNRNIKKRLLKTKYAYKKSNNLMIVYEHVEAQILEIN